MQKIIILNWKANGTNAMCDKFVKIIEKNILRNKLILCPPACFLNKFELIKNANFSLGAQNCSIKSTGAWTGEIPCEILKNCGVKYVIIGHSERREFFKETENDILEKLTKAHDCGLIPILCVGKNLAKELKVLKKISFDVMVAYEPLWAIGTGKVAGIEDCLKVRKMIDKKFSFIYGGSVYLDNYEQFLNASFIDGLLIGGASLKENVMEMCK